MHENSCVGVKGHIYKSVYNDLYRNEKGRKERYKSTVFKYNI